MKYRKKPMIVDAFKWTGDQNQTQDPEWIIEALNMAAMEVGAAIIYDAPVLFMSIQINPDEIITILPGEYILRDANGKTWTIKPDIFEATYEPVEGQ